MQTQARSIRIWVTNGLLACLRKLVKSEARDVDSDMGDRQRLFFWGYGVTQHSETLVMSPWLSLLRTLAPRPLLSSRYDSKRAPPVLRRGRWAPSVGEWLLFPAGWATLSLRKPHPLQLCIFTNQTVCELFPDYFGTLKFVDQTVFLF